MSRRARKAAPVPPAPSNDLAALQARLNERVKAVEKNLAAASSVVDAVNEPPISRLGRRLVEAALARLDHHDPDRAVVLTNTYIALVTEDERARA